MSAVRLTRRHREALAQIATGDYDITAPMARTLLAYGLVTSDHGTLKLTSKGCEALS